VSEWAGWGVDRVVLALAAVLYFGIWAQVSLMHWAGAFKHPAMWGPVLATPLVIAAALVGLFVRTEPCGWVVAALLAVGVLEGVGGLLFHLRGMRYQVGGISMRSLLNGPPPMLPVAYSLTGVLGLVGLLWNA
jgi:hypothetical protein